MFGSLYFRSLKLSSKNLERDFFTKNEALQAFALIVGELRLSGVIRGIVELGAIYHPGKSGLAANLLVCAFGEKVSSQF